MRPITTDGALIAAASSAHRGPTTLPPTSPRSGSGADPFSAASSTNTSGPHRSPVQGRWPSSKTPQALGLARRRRDCEVQGEVLARLDRDLPLVGAPVGTPRDHHV